MNATLEEKISELERELRFRQWAYPTQVRRKKMSISEASKRLRILQEILADYQRQTKNQTDLFTAGAQP